jgi:excisionase family DNA binding protein
MAQIATLDAFTTGEVAEMFGVSRMTVWRHVRDGKLPVRRHAGRNVFYAVDLLEYALKYHNGRGIPVHSGA